MTDLRIIGRSEDGNFLELTDTEGNEFRLEVDGALKATIAAPHLVAVANSYEQGDEVVVTVKEIQARLRAGETMADIAYDTDWSLEKIDKYSGPILQERAYVISIALKTALRRDSHAPNLETAAHSRLGPRGVDLSAIEWNTHRVGDGIWEIVLTYPNREGESTAVWNFDLHNHSITAVDDDAKWINGEEREARAKLPTHGMVYTTDQSAPAPRLVAVREEEIVETIRISTTPVTERVEIEPDAKKDGVTKRIRIPSWDDIMFGGKNEEE